MRVRRLTTSGGAVEVVVGKAGTGKPSALDAARHAWQQAGIDVNGFALAAAPPTNPKTPQASPRPPSPPASPSRRPRCL
jgi:hypothetical protein